MSKIFNKIEIICTNISNRLTYCILYVVNPGHSLSEVVNGAMQYNASDSEEKLNYPLSKENSDLILDEAKSLKKSEDERRKILDEKTHTLITFCSILLVLTGILQSFIIQKLSILLPIIPIILALLLVLKYYRIQTEATICLSDIDISKPKEIVKKNIIEQYLNAVNYNAPRNDYRVDIYRAAVRLMTIGILAIIGIVLFDAIDKQYEVKEYTHDSTIMPTSEIIICLFDCDGQSSFTDAIIIVNCDDPLRAPREEACSISITTELVNSVLNRMYRIYEILIEILHYSINHVNNMYEAI